MFQVFLNVGPTQPCERPTDNSTTFYTNSWTNEVWKVLRVKTSWLEILLTRSFCLESVENTSFRMEDITGWKILSLEIFCLEDIKIKEQFVVTNRHTIEVKQKITRQNSLILRRAPFPTATLSYSRVQFRKSGFLFPKSDASFLLSFFGFLKLVWENRKSTKETNRQLLPWENGDKSGEYEVSPWSQCGTENYPSLQWSQFQHGRRPFLSWHEETLSIPMRNTEGHMKRNEVNANWTSL